MCGKSSVQVRADMRHRLAKSLALGEKQKAFAKSCDLSSRPRADDLEAMMKAFPGLDRINYDAESVASGINEEVWKFWHARHCLRCLHSTPCTKIAIFKVLLHFLKTGIEPTVEQGADIDTVRLSRVVYVDKWREEESRCRMTFAKWEADSSGLMSSAACGVKTEAGIPIVAGSEVKI